VIPKSSHRDRIFENADIFDFEISGEDMERMNKLDENLRSSPDPNEMD
jgi:diketogulonate reductase-like aldo/keto reductase